MPFVELHGGAKLRYRESGAERGGHPLLLVHGAGGSSASWLPLMGRLGRHRRVVALDLPGHGRSGGAVTSVEEMRDAVGLAAATLCLGPSVLVGHSLGGLVALAAALAWPDKVAGLVLVTTGARIRVSPALFQALDGGWARWPELMAEVAFSPETPGDLRRRAAALATAAEKAQTRADFEAVAAVDFRSRLVEIATPTRVISGAHDQLTPPKLSEALAAGIAGARLVTIPRAGHMPMFEQTDALAAAILEFAGVAARTI